MRAIERDKKARFLYPCGVKKSRLVANVIAALFVATLVKLVFNLLCDNGVNWDYPRWSAQAAKERGVFVTTVKPDPVSFDRNGTIIRFHEVWIEREVHTSHPLIWLSRLEPSGRDYLCFTLERGNQLFSGPNRLIFASDGIQYGGCIGQMISKSKMMFFAELNPGIRESCKTNLGVVTEPVDPLHPIVTLSW